MLEIRRMRKMIASLLIFRFFSSCIITKEITGEEAWATLPPPPRYDVLQVAGPSLTRMQCSRSVPSSICWGWMQSCGQSLLRIRSVCTPDKRRRCQHTLHPRASTIHSHGPPKRHQRADTGNFLSTILESQVACDSEVTENIWLTSRYLYLKLQHYKFCTAEIYGIF